MTLSLDEDSDFEVREGPNGVAVGRSTVVVSEDSYDEIRTARTRSDGEVVSSVSYAVVSNRKPGTDVLGREAGHVVAPEDRKPIVTEWSGMDDYDNAPPSYQVCFTQYHSYITHLVRTMGVHPRDLEDVVADIEARFLERDSLGEFRADWATRSARGRSVFRSYLSRFVVTYARGKFRNEVRRAKRYQIIVDAPVGEAAGATWLDRYDQETGGVGQPQIEVEFSDFVVSLRDRVGGEVVAAVQQLVDERRKVTIASLRAALEVQTGKAVSARQVRRTLDDLRVAAAALA